MIVLATPKYPSRYRTSYRREAERAGGEAESLLEVEVETAVQVLEVAA